MKLTLDNVVDVKIGPVKNGTTRNGMPHYREVEIQVGSGEAITLHLNAWRKDSLGVSRAQ